MEYHNQNQADAAIYCVPGLTNLLVHVQVGDISPTPEKWGSDCSKPPMKVAGDISTLLLIPGPPILIDYTKCSRHHVLPFKTGTLE